MSVNTEMNINFKKFIMDESQKSEQKKMYMEFHIFISRQDVSNYNLPSFPENTDVAMEVPCKINLLWTSLTKCKLYVHNCHTVGRCAKYSYENTDEDKIVSFKNFSNLNLLSGEFDVLKETDCSVKIPISSIVEVFSQKEYLNQTHCLVILPAICSLCLKIGKSSNHTSKILMKVDINALQSDELPEATYEDSEDSEIEDSEDSDVEDLENHNANIQR